MKVNFTPTITNQKPNILTRFKRFLVSKLKPLPKDTFEKSAVEQSEKKIIVSRKYPNWCDGPDSAYRNNTIAQRICYYPEDLKKMETMTREERNLYKDYLDDKGRFYYDDNYNVETPELDKITKEYGIDITKFVMKDNP